MRKCRGKKVWRDKVEREIRRGGRKSGVRN